MRCVKKILILAGLAAILAAMIVPVLKTSAQEVESGVFKLNAVYSTSEVRRTGVTACGGSTQMGGAQGAATYVGYICYSGSVLYFGYAIEAEDTLPQSVTLRVSSAITRLVPYTEVGAYNLQQTRVRTNGYQQYALAISANPFSPGAAFKTEVFRGSTTDVPLLVHYEIPLANNQLVVYGVEAPPVRIGNSTCTYAGYSDTIAGSSQAEPLYVQQLTAVFYRDCAASTTNDGILASFGGALFSASTTNIGVWIDGTTRFYALPARAADEFKIIPPTEFNAVGSLLYQQPMIITLSSGSRQPLNFRAPPAPATPEGTSKYGEGVITDFTVRAVNVYRTTYTPDPLSYQTVAPYSLVFLMSYQAPANFDVDMRDCLVKASLHGFSYVANGIASQDALGSVDLLTGTNKSDDQALQRLRPLVEYEIDENTGTPFYYTDATNGKGRGLIYGEIIPRPNINFTGQPSSVTKLDQNWHVNGTAWYTGAPASHTTNGSPVLQWQLECNQRLADGSYRVVSATYPFDVPPPSEPGSSERLDIFRSFLKNFYTDIIGALFTFNQVWDKTLVNFSGAPTTEGNLILQRLIPNYEDVFQYLEKHGVTDGFVFPTPTPAPAPSDNPNQVGGILTDAIASAEQISRDWNLPLDMLMAVLASIPAMVALYLLLQRDPSAKAFYVASFIELFVLSASAVVGLVAWEIAGGTIIIVIIGFAAFMFKRMRD